MILNQNLYTVSIHQLEELRKLIKYKPDLIPLWESNNTKDSISWKNRLDISQTICSLGGTMESGNIQSFQEGFSWIIKDEGHIMPGLERTKFYYVYIESY